MKAPLIINVIRGRFLFWSEGLARLLATEYVMLRIVVVLAETHKHLAGGKARTAVSVRTGAFTAFMFDRTRSRGLFSSHISFSVLIRSTISSTQERNDLKAV